MEKDKSEKSYRDLLASIDEGFCVVEVLFNGEDEPVDYLYLEANRAFEDMTGLKDVVGKRMLELVPDLELFWIQKYGDVAVTGNPVRRERYSVSMDRWLDIYALRFGNAETRNVAVFLKNISRRKFAEEALRESESHLRLAIETANLEDWVLDLRTNKAKRSLRHDQIFGYNNLLPEWTYDLFLSHIHPDDRNKVDQNFRDARSAGKYWDSSCRIIRADGRERWIWVRGRFQYDNDGQAVRTMGLISDITGRKRIEESYKTETETINQLQSFSSRLLAVTDNNAALEEVLDASITLLGADYGNVRLYDPESETLDLVSQRGFKEGFLNLKEKVTAGNDSSCAMALKQRGRITVDDTETHPGYKTIRNQARKAGYRSLQSTPMISKDGNVTGVLTTYFRNKRRLSGREIRIHDLYIHQAANQIERLQTQQRLRQSEELFRSIVEGATEFAIFTTDIKGRINSWNTGAERLLGWSEKEVISQPSAIIFPDNGKYSSEIADREMEITKKEGRAKDERVHIKKDGSRFWASGMMMSMTNDAGELSGYIKILQDTTERKKYEETQRLLVGELDHRIKNTLATIQAIAGQTLQQTSNPGQFVEDFNGRLRALGKAHSLLTKKRWKGADVQSILLEQLTFKKTSRITYSGPFAFLSPQAALHLALVLHELGTNALKHGALSSPEGRLIVKWLIEHEDNRPIIKLSWKESNGPKIEPPDKSGFGRTLIEQSLQSVGGRTSLVFNPSGIHCKIILPLSDLPQKTTTNTYGT